MAPRTLPLLLTLALLSACQAPGVAPTRPSKVQTASATPSPAPSASPTAVPTASPAASYDLLKAPASAHVVLDGSVLLDAHYLLKNGFGTIISTGGGNIIGHAAGNIIATGGGNIISTGGGNIVSTGGGNIVSTGGGNLIGHAGGNLIGKRKYRALAEPALALGEVLRAAEMEIQALPLEGGDPIPLGVDGKGAPVTTIYSNVSGDFRLYMPEGQKDYVLVARVPGSTDPRHEYHLLPGAFEQARTLDEDSNQVTRFLRAAFVARLTKILGWNTQSASFIDIVLTGNGLPPEQAALLVGLPNVKKISDAIDAASHLKALTPEARQALARRTADALLPHLKMERVKMTGSSQLVYDALIEVVKATREAATAKMRELEAAGQDPAGPWAAIVQKANELDQPAEPYAIKKPSDVNDFALRHIVANPDAHRFQNLAGLMAAAGASEEQLAKLEAATKALITNFAMVLATDEQAVDTLLGLIDEGGS